MSLLRSTRSLTRSLTRVVAAAPNTATRTVQTTRAAPVVRSACVSLSRSFASHVNSRDPDAGTANGEIDGATLFGSGFEHLSLRYSPPLQCLTVTMNRPDLHNAFNEHVIRELTTLFRTLSGACATDPTTRLGALRAVVLTGAGTSFSAGADLNWMKKMKDYTEAQNLNDSKQLFNMFLMMHRCPVPLIARVNGAALGGGVGLVSVCDIAISVVDAKFGLTEVKLGLSPAVISSFVMSKLSPAAANYFFLTGARFGAKEAQQHGLINQVVADASELDIAVKHTLEELALNSPKAGQNNTTHTPYV